MIETLPANAQTASDDKAQAIIHELNDLISDRAVTESHWQEIAERVWPTYSRSFNPNWFTTPGQKKNEFVFDSTAALAANRFGAILDSLLTPRNQTWHRIRVSNRKLAKNREVQLYFEAVNRTLFEYRYAPKANFAAQNQQVYKGLGVFGTGALFIDALFGFPGVRYRSIHLGEIYFVENHQGIVDKAFRAFKLKARQALQKWGDRCPDRIRETAKNKPEQDFQFVHLVEPREERDTFKLDQKNMAFASFYVSKDESKIIVEEGYRVFPYTVSRYEQGPGEVYGRSIGMDLLPAIKTLNEEKKTVLKSGHRAVDPVLLAHDDGVLDGFSMKPGALNPGGVSADGRPLVHALPTGNLQIGKELMDDERTLINDGFLISLFQILTESPQMTATEVLERAKEKGMLVAPTTGRIQSEHLGPMIERELDLLTIQGLLPPMPLLLKQARGEYKLEYDSPLSRAQRAEEASGLMRTVESAVQVVNVTQDQSLLDHFDWDIIVPEMAEIQGVQAHWIRSPDSVAQVRQGRAQSQQTQAAIQAAPGAAALMNAQSNQPQQTPQTPVQQPVTPQAAPTNAPPQRAPRGTKGVFPR